MALLLRCGEVTFDRSGRRGRGSLDRVRPKKFGAVVPDEFTSREATLACINAAS